MPQLDKVTFLSQFFWLCFFYLGFYYIVLKYFLPKMARVLKLRKKKMNLSQEGMTFLQQENKQVNSIYDTILSKGLGISKKLLYQNFKDTSSWLNNVVKDTNKAHYLSLNNAFIHSVGENSLSENLLIYHTKKNLPEKLFLKVVIDKITNLDFLLQKKFHKQKFNATKNQDLLESKKNKKLRGRA